MARIDVKYKGSIDSRGKVVADKVRCLMEEGALRQAKIDRIDVIDSYSINKEFSIGELVHIIGMLHNNVVQEARLDNCFDIGDADYVLEIGFKPGVTDNVGNTVRKGIEAKLNEPFADNEGVHSSELLIIKGEVDEKLCRDIGEMLANPLIQNIVCTSAHDFKRSMLEAYVPKVVLGCEQGSIVVPIRIMDQDELRLIAKKGIIDPMTGCHRGPLALDIDDAAPMRVIVDYFNKVGRDPTDVELECLAQTWSEHCKHTIFAAALDDDIKEGLFKKYIRGATEEIRRRWKALGKEDFLLSVFSDNSGIIKFDKYWAITEKVETHNSPSALDPYGGAITGIVGVDRDAIGAGMGAIPFNHRFYFCFADPKSKRKLFRDKRLDGTLEGRILSPRSIMDGVVSGVKDGGNKSGIPTSQGGAFFHDSYGGKPLVFVGVQGLIPLEKEGDRIYEKKARPGDLVVMVGGRVGLDGIHGATFSSESMDSGSPNSAVQIGDPITQKKMSDALLKEVRDLKLYDSITDNGAGGLSCSVYEMARECGGATIELDKVPLKYHGMRPDQILISESQERMTLAIPEDNISGFMDIMRKHDVEATVIGRFDDSGRCRANFNGKNVLDIDINFLHDGLPQRVLESDYEQDSYGAVEPDFDEPDDLTGSLEDMLSRLNICSKEFVFEQFDHEVQGGSVVKPLVGKGKVDSDATVNRPVLESWKGVAATQSLYPRYGLIDTYNMAACAIDTVVRNLIAVGGRLDRIALLDNFCWCSSDEPERLGQLKRAVKACYDLSTAYLAPFISGKDSMFNTFKGFDENGNKIVIDALPTLLVSGLSIVDDVRKCQTLDAKCAGDIVYVVGITYPDLGGSEYYDMVGEKIDGAGFLGHSVPEVVPDSFLDTYKAMERAIERGLVASCCSVSSGGLGVALAKTAIGGGLGMELDLDNLIAQKSVVGTEYADEILFSESQGRFVVTVDPRKCDDFESMLYDVPFCYVGKVTDDRDFRVFLGKDEKVIDARVANLAENYKKRLRGY